jgi:hypothetical protein
MILFVCHSKGLHTFTDRIDNPRRVWSSIWYKYSRYEICVQFPSYANWPYQGHFYLTKLLLPILLSTSTPEEKSRVVSLSSIASYVTGLDFDTFKDSPKRREKINHLLYAQSKLVCVIIHVYATYLTDYRPSLYTPKSSPVDTVTKLWVLQSILVRSIQKLS